MRAQLRHRALFKSVPLAAMAIVAALAYGGPRSANAASGSLRVDAPPDPVAVGSSAVVNIVQTSDGETIGAEATIDFDPSILQIQDVSVGPDYANATVLVSAPRDPNNPAGRGTPPSLEEAIVIANSSGNLPNLTAFLVPGSGTVPAGESVFVALTLEAIGPGTSSIALSAPEMLDSDGNSLEVTAAGGSVLVEGSGAPPPDDPAPGVTAAATVAAPPGSTPAARQTPTALSGVLSNSRAASATSATISVQPASQKVAKDSSFTFQIKQEVDGAASQAQTNLTFKKDLVEITKLEPGSGWKTTASAIESAMSDANSSGELKVTLTADKQNPPSTSGESDLLTVTMRGISGKEGKSALKFSTVELIGSDGSSVSVTQRDGEVIVGSAGGGSSLIWIVLGVIVAAAVVGGGAFFVRKRMMQTGGV